MTTPSHHVASTAAILATPGATARPALMAAGRLRREFVALGIPSGTPFTDTLLHLLVLRAERRKLDPVLLFENCAPIIVEVLAGFRPARGRGFGRRVSALPPRSPAPLDVLDAALVKEVASLNLGHGLDEVAIVWIAVAALVIEHGGQNAQAPCANAATVLRAHAKGRALRQTA